MLCHHREPVLEEVKPKGKGKNVRIQQKKTSGGVKRKKAEKEVAAEAEVEHEQVVENVASSTRSSRRNKKEVVPKEIEPNDENGKEDDEIEMEEAEAPKKKAKPKKKAAAKSKKVTLLGESDNQMPEQKEEKDTTPKNIRGKNKRQEVGDLDTEESPKKAKVAGKKAASKKAPAKPKKALHSDAEETDELNKAH